MSKRKDYYINRTRKFRRSTAIATLVAKHFCPQIIPAYTESSSATFPVLLPESLEHTEALQSVEPPSISPEPSSLDQGGTQIMHHPSPNQGLFMPAKKPVSRPVIVTTAHRGVFYGHAADTTGDTIQLTGSRMAIRFGTTRGIVELAETGPTGSSKISARADVAIRNVTAVFEVTPDAAEKWEAA